MLSSLSNYLFNTASPLEDVTNLRNNAEYQTQELDDDWLLVNALGEKTEESSPSDSSEAEASDSRSTSPNQAVKKSQNQFSRRSRNPALKLRVPTSTPDQGSPPSSPNQQMDGSWYVTPPPCFTASRKGLNLIETSPMENLLIEHPSMSVYGPIPGFSFLQGSQYSDSSDTSPVRDLDLWVPRTATPRNLSLERNSVSDEEQARVSRTTRRNLHRRISCSNLDSVLEEQRFAIQSRGYQQQREQRKMKPSYLERQNLVRQNQSYRRQRNHNHLKQPNKFCNNRC